MEERAAVWVRNLILVNYLALWTETPSWIFIPSLIERVITTHTVISMGVITYFIWRWVRSRPLACSVLGAVQMAGLAAFILVNLIFDDKEMAVFQFVISVGGMLLPILALPAESIYARRTGGRYWLPSLRARWSFMAVGAAAPAAILMALVFSAVDWSPKAVPVAASEPKTVWVGRLAVTAPDGFRLGTVTARASWPEGDLRLSDNTYSETSGDWRADFEKRFEDSPENAEKQARSREIDAKIDQIFGNVGQEMDKLSDKLSERITGKTPDRSSEETQPAPEEPPRVRSVRQVDELFQRPARLIYNDRHSELKLEAACPEGGYVTIEYWDPFRRSRDGEKPAMTPEEREA